MLKTYRIYRESARSVRVSVDGNPFIVGFRSSGRVLEYSTRDKKIQEAIEKDARFNHFICLVYTEKDEVTPDVIKQKEDKAETKNPKEKEDVVKEVITNVSDITTIQQAKAFLRANGVEIAKSATLEKVIEVAKENGFDFSNLSENIDSKIN